MWPAAKKTRESVVLNNLTIKHTLAHAYHHVSPTFLWQDASQLHQLFGGEEETSQKSRFTIRAFQNATQLSEETAKSFEDQRKLALARVLYCHQLDVMRQGIEADAHKALRGENAPQQLQEELKRDALIDSLKKINSTDVTTVKQGVKDLAAALTSECPDLDAVEDIGGVLEQEKIRQLLTDAHKELSSLDVTQGNCELTRDISHETAVFDYTKSDTLFEMNLHLLKCGKISKHEFWELNDRLFSELDRIKGALEAPVTEDSYGDREQLARQYINYAYYAGEINHTTYSEKIRKIEQETKPTVTLVGSVDEIRNGLNIRLERILSEDATIEGAQNAAKQVFFALNRLTNDAFGEYEEKETVDQLKKFLARKGILSETEEGGWLEWWRGTNKHITFSINPQIVNLLDSPQDTTIKIDGENKIIRQSAKAYVLNDDETTPQRIQRLKKITEARRALDIITTDEQCTQIKQQIVDDAVAKLKEHSFSVKVIPAQEQIKAISKNIQIIKDPLKSNGQHLQAIYELAANKSQLGNIDFSEIYLASGSAGILEALATEKIIFLPNKEKLIHTYIAQHHLAEAIKHTEDAEITDFLIKTLQNAPNLLHPNTDHPEKAQLSKHKERTDKLLTLTLDKVETTLTEWHDSARAIAYENELLIAETSLIKPLLVLELISRVDVASNNLSTMNILQTRLDEFFSRYSAMDFAAGDPRGNYDGLLKRYKEINKKGNEKIENPEDFQSSVNDYLKDIRERLLKLVTEDELGKIEPSTQYPELNKLALWDANRLSNDLKRYFSAKQNGQVDEVLPLTKKNMDVIRVLSDYSGALQDRRHAQAILFSLDALNALLDDAELSTTAFEASMSQAKSFYKLAHQLQLIEFSSLKSKLDELDTFKKDVIAIEGTDAQKQDKRKETVTKIKESLSELTQIMSASARRHQSAFEQGKVLVEKQAEKSKKVHKQLISLQQKVLGVEEDEINIKALIKKIKKDISSIKESKVMKDLRPMQGEYDKKLVQLTEVLTELKTIFQKDAKSSLDQSKALFALCVEKKHEQLIHQLEEELDTLERNGINNLEQWDKKCGALLSVSPESIFFSELKDKQDKTATTLAGLGGDSLLKHAQQEEKQVSRLYKDIIKKLEQFKTEQQLEGHDVKIIDRMILSAKQAEKLFPSKKQKIHYLNRVLNILDKLSIEKPRDFIKMAQHFQEVKSFKPDDLVQLEKEIEIMEDHAEGKKPYFEVKIEQFVNGGSIFTIEEHEGAELDTTIIIDACKKILTMDTQGQEEITLDSLEKDLVFKGKFAEKDIVIKIDKHHVMHIRETGNELSLHEKIRLMNTLSRCIVDALVEKGENVLNAHLIPKEDADLQQARRLSM